MESHLTVDYDQLVSAYRESLTTVLRGFRPPAELLETWVPDEDDTRSILNLIEAAEGAGLLRISIYIGPSTFRRLDLNSLHQAASQRAKVRTEPHGEGSLLHISFASSGTHALSARVEKSPSAKNNPQLTVRKENGLPAPHKAPSPRAAGWPGTRAVHPVYQEKFRAESQRSSHEGTLLPEDGLELMQASRQDTTLTALVEPRQHVIKRAAFHGAHSNDERAVLSVLCKFMEGRPILECAEHAMIYVERELRDHSQPAPVCGVVTPENADPIFSSPAFLVRELLACYRRRTGFSGTANFYDPPTRAEWLALREGEKVAKVQAAIARHPLGAGIEVLRTEGPKRVSVRFQDVAGHRPKVACFMRVEAYVHAEVEPTLELETESRPDGNKIRHIQIKEMNKS